MSLDSLQKYSVKLTAVAGKNLLKGVWIVVLHAERIPPHIGLMFNGKYCSLNLKSTELDIDLAVLMRKIEMQQIKTLFIKLMPHPVFSVHFQYEHFVTELEGFERVTTKTTCFAPVKNFMSENYLLRKEKMNYLYELFPLLYKENMIECAAGLYLKDENEFVFNVYSGKDIEDKLNSIEHLRV